MGIEYNASLAIGFVIAKDDVLMPFEMTLAEESKLEPRYNPKTGKPTSPEKVITRPERTIYEFNQTTYEEEKDGQLLDALCFKIGSLARCEVQWEISGAPSEGGTEFIIFSPKLPKGTIRSDFEYDGPGAIIGGEMDVSAIIQLSKRKLPHIARALKKMGFHVQAAQVIVIHNVG
jgi:hypothetical protein